MLSEPNIIIQNRDCKCIGIEPAPKESIDFNRYGKEHKTVYLVPVADSNGSLWYNVYAPIN